MNVTLKTNDNSSRRTRNRIRENGPNFRAERSRAFPDGILFGELCWLLRGENGWLGWLPRNEFDWTHTDALPRGDWKNVVPWKSTESDDFRDMMPDRREFYSDYDDMGWKD